MFGPIGGAVGLGVGLGQLMLGEGFRVGAVSVRHVAIVVEASQRQVDRHGGVITAPRLVQAMPGGAEEVKMTYEHHWTSRHAYARLPEDYPGQGQDAAAIAQMMADDEVPYSYASYAALAGWKLGYDAPRLTNWINRRRDPIDFTNMLGQACKLALPVEAICSVLAEQSWTMAGKKVMIGVQPQCVTPGALAGQLLQDPDVEWGWPSSLL